jgi:hypothetical protein
MASGTKPEAREAIASAGETQATIVDLKFCDLRGTWQLTRSGASAVFSRRGARLRP